MELRQLEYFQSVAKLGSISKAADLHNITQPSVSVAIKNLEKELGVKLLDRSRKRCTLTSEGHIFLQRVNFLLGCFHDILLEMNDYRIPQKGQVKIGITPIMGTLLFPHAFANFQKENPDVNIIIEEEGSLVIRNKLEQGELDLGIMVTSNLPSPLDVFQITTGQIHVYLPPDDPFSSYPSVPLEKLRDHPFILFKEDTYMRQMILDECAWLNFSPSVVFSSSQIGTILSLVEQGTGITFFLEGVLKESRNVISRPLSDPLHLDVGLAWNKDRYLSKTAKLFIESLQKTFRTSK